MKKVLIIIIGFLLWTAILYGMFAFVQAELNSMNWSKDARGGFAFCSFIYLAFMPLIYLELKDMKL
jgi:hypothetical protein